MSQEVEAAQEQGKLQAARLTHPLPQPHRITRRRHSLRQWQECQIRISPVTSAQILTQNKLNAAFSHSCQRREFVEESITYPV